MINLPVTPALIKYTQDLVIDGAKTFSALDDASQDTLVALAIEALDSDVEIILSIEANHLLAKYLLSHDRDDEIEFREAVKVSAREHFADQLDELVSACADSIEEDKAYEVGLRPFKDKDNGEIRWL